MYKLPNEEIIKIIKAKKAKRVLIQAPEGLKTKLLELSDELTRETSAEIFILAEPCWGACDLADEKALKLMANLLIHIGHVPIYKEKIETAFIPLTPFFNIDKTKDKILDVLYEKNVTKVGLISSSQFTPFLEKIGEKLEEEGAEVFIGKGSNRVKKLGQVLGCNYSTVKAIEKDVKLIVYIGDGLFHPLGAALTTKVPVIAINPYTLKVNPITKERDDFIRKRFALITAAKEAETFGILISTKKGQLRIKTANEIKKILEERKKKAYFLVSDYINSEHYLGIKIDCFVNTACPRLAIDNHYEFKKPVLNLNEIKILFGLKPLMPYKMDEI